MASLPEGSIERPYRENPPTRVVEVHWTGGIAVKWNYAQFLYHDGALPVADSATGTLSVWLKFHPDSMTKTAAMSLFFSDWIEFEVTARDDQSTVVDDRPFERAYHKFKFFPFDADSFFDQPADRFAYLLDTGDAFAMTTPPKWFHVFARWNTDAGTLALTVNGRPLATRVVSGEDVDPDRYAGPPFVVPWSYPIDNSGEPNNSQFLSNTDYYDLAVGFSIAELWLDIGDPFNAYLPGPAINKFVDLTTGQPVPLGADGDKPTGHKPAFYFARTGTPQSFVRNRGYGGEFTFARGFVDDGTLAFSSIDLIGPAIDADPPLDEPERPQFTPIPAAAAA